MKATIRVLYDIYQNKTGTILSVNLDKAFTPQEKERCESLLEQYARNKLYPDHDLSIYRETQLEIPSILVVKNFEHLSERQITINETDCESGRKKRSAYASIAPRKKLF